MLRITGFLIFASFCPFIEGQTTSLRKVIPCGVIWKDFSLGTPVPSEGIAVDETQEFPTYVIRGLLDTTYYLGTYDPVLEFPLLPIEDFNTTSAIELQILTNPYACNLTWGDGGMLSTHDVRVEGRVNETIVSRVRYDGILVAGQSSLNYPNQIEIGLLSEGENSTLIGKYPKPFQYLYSWGDNLELHLVAFEFDDDPFGGAPSFVGVEEIQNLANVTLTQTITHSKRVRQTTTITITEKWTSTYTKTVKINLGFYKKTKTETTTVSRTETTSVTTVDETDIEMSKQILVPPYTEIQACSVITMRENFKSPYVATGKYVAKGLNPDIIREILDRDKIYGHWKVGEEVFIDVEGELSGSVAMSSSFVVAPLGSKDGCAAAVQKEQNALANRRQRFRDEL